MIKQQNDKAKGNWSKIRNAVFGNASNPADLSGVFKRPFEINPAGYHSKNRRDNDLVLCHGNVLVFLSI